MTTIPLLALALTAASSLASITAIELTPTDLGSADSSYFTVRPTSDPALFFGVDYGDNARRVDFNTAPDGSLSEGGVVNTQYSSLGVTMNDIRISASIYGGNNYGPGFAAEYDLPQIYNFTIPVIAAGIVNTSPDRDLIQFWSGPDATGTLLLEFHDQEAVNINYNIDRFVGAIASEGVTIGSMRVSNASGNLELDELIFVVSPDTIICPADLNGDATLNFFDISAFLGAFADQNPDADFTDDGQFNFFDVSAFLSAYTQGCP